MLRAVLAACVLLPLVPRLSAQNAAAFRHSGPLAVVATSPLALSVASPTAPMTVSFDRPLDLSTVSSSTFRVAGEVSGPADGVLDFADLGRRLVFLPARPFQAGEVVWVHLSHELRGLDRSHLRPGGYAFQFRAAVAASGGTFSPATTFDNDSSPNHTDMIEIVPSDLDRDLLPDLVTLNKGTHDLRTFLNLGSLAFDSARTTPIPGSVFYPLHIEVADVSSDGLPDALATDLGLGDLHVFLGLQNGFFADIQTLPFVGRFTLLDVDGDADLDLATVLLHSIQLWLNDGNGAFLSGPLVDSGMTGPEQVEAGDMNGDGLTDLLVTGETNSLSGDLARTMLSDGQGGFTPAGPVAQLTGGETVAVSLGDVDGDRDLDVCLANAYYETLGVLRNLGNGVFQSVSVLNFGASPTSSALGDLDGDGDLDWLLAGGRTNMGEPSWRAYRNDGTGAFLPLAEIAASLEASSACLLDADGDGDLDLALGDGEAEQVSIQTND